MYRIRNITPHLIFFNKQQYGKSHKSKFYIPKMFSMAKKTSFFISFVAAHLLFACLYIDKQSRFIKLSYEKQTHERTIKSLLTDQQILINKLHLLKNHRRVALFAQEKLGMKPLFLKNIKPLPQPKSVTHEYHKQT